MLSEHCSGWRGSWCKELGSIAGILYPCCTDRHTATSPWVCFVGVYPRRLPTIFSFWPRNLYIFIDVLLVASRGMDHSSTPATDWRSNRDTYDFLRVRKREIDTNASDTPVPMHDAGDDHGIRFHSGEFRLAGTLNKTNHCNNYDATPYRWNIKKNVICIIRMHIIQKI